MLSELFSALIPRAHAEEQPAKQENESSENKEGGGEAKEEEPAEEEPVDVCSVVVSSFPPNVELTWLLALRSMFSPVPVPFRRPPS